MKPFRFFLPITRTVPAKREVYGFLSVAKSAAGEVVVDSYGSYVTVEDLDTVAHRYLVEARGVGEQHTFIGVGEVIESAVLTREKQKAMPPLGIPEGHVHEGWWVGYRVTSDEAWDKVVRGELLGLSIGGYSANTEATRRFASDQGKPPVWQFRDLVVLEGSLVDRPSNPLCTFALFRREGVDAPPNERSTMSTTPAPSTPAASAAPTARMKLKALMAQKRMDGAAAMPPSTNQILLEKEFQEDLWELKCAYEESCDRISWASLPMGTMLEALYTSTDQYMAGLGSIRDQLAAGMATERAVDVNAPLSRLAQVETLLLAFVSEAKQASAGEEVRTHFEALKRELNALSPHSAAKNRAAEAAEDEHMSMTKEEKDALESVTRGMRDLQAARAEDAKKLTETVERAVKLEAENAVLKASMESAKADAKAAVERAANAEIERAAQDFTVPGLTQEETVTVLRAARGTPLDALVQKTFRASTEMARRLGEPVGVAAHNADGTTPAQAAYAAALEDTMTKEKVDRVQALSILRNTKPALVRDAMREARFN